MKKNEYAPTLLVLEDAVRALRDIAELDETRPARNAPEKVAERALERISKAMGEDVTYIGRTPRPTERMFTKVLAIDTPAPGQHPNVQHVRAEGAPFYTGPIGTQINPA